MNKENNYIEINRQSWNNRTETHLKSGKFYHPYASKMTYNADISEKSGYTEYTNTGSYKYFSGYGPGYPVNINYISSVISSQSVPVILNGTDNRINQFNQQWPITTNLSVYNFDFNNATNFADTYGFSEINNVFDDFGVLYNIKFSIINFIDKISKTEI
jgi:hypothetical protein